MNKHNQINIQTFIETTSKSAELWILIDFLQYGNYSRFPIFSQYILQ